MYPRHYEGGGIIARGRGVGKYVLDAACSSMPFVMATARASAGRLGSKVINRSYEGYVAKDEASAYEGGATKRWLKVKVPGWTDSDDRQGQQLAARNPIGPLTP